ncbi:uncharacterized protein LOC123227834 [Mangifera indica]|uniref:uncharacterized protein LOC123227834 n=1 Tax=Mangifera indica TaxID=29780 RepID=UPI001CFAF38F|nr:uncharacterized protein LOC123227834 [Mangifera indica]
MADKKFKLKLPVDNEAKKVLFAEAGKEIADFLIYLLSLPVGTVARLLEKKSMVGCLGNLYQSIKERRNVYKCAYSSNSNVAENPKIVCPSCNRQMTREVPYLTASSKSVGTSTAAVGEGGFVKGVVTYVIMDNLVLKPMSTISSIALLNKFNVKDVRSLEKKVVDFGVEEGVKLLKASLECRNILTSVFLSSIESQKISS